VEIAEVIDRESLKAHLGTLPKMPRLRTALWIASRSATRVSPFAIKFLLGRASEKNGAWVGLLALAAGMSVLRWPVIFLTRWAKRVVGRYG
jgi:hypothetical protein